MTGGTPDPEYSTLDERELTAQFRSEINDVVGARLPSSSVLFISIMLIAVAIEAYYFPERSSYLLLCFTLLVATCGVGIVAVRMFPNFAALTTLIASSTLTTLLAAYLTFIERSGELSLMAMIGFITGLVVQFPWGPRFQTVAVAAVMVTYLVSLFLGARPHLPMAYGIFSLAAIGLMTIIGASLLNRYRWTAFHQAARAKQHAAEAARQAAQAQQNAVEAARANQSKTDFLATVSHELRTPLNIIFGYTDLLIDDALGEAAERQVALHRIREQSGNLLDMIQAMLDINKLEAGGVDIVPAPFKIGDFMHHLEGAIPANWGKEGVSLVWQVPGPNAVMISDSDKIEVVLRNLIHNALKYTDRGEVLVQAAAVPGNGHVDFTVADTGQGIPPDDLERIFNMFQQSSSAPPRQGGVGLGLFLAKQLTSALGGSIRAESDIGSGSRFTVALPLEISAQE